LVQEDAASLCRCGDCCAAKEALTLSGTLRRRLFGALSFPFYSPDDAVNPFLLTYRELFRHIVPMAYPFPRFANTPQSPQFVQGVESPRISTRRGSATRSSSSRKRVAAVVLVVTAILLWLIDPFSRPVKQTDNIPFSHDEIDEYFAWSNFFSSYT